MHHKKKKPPAARAACKLCKPWKLNSASKNRKSNLTRWQRVERIEIAEQVHGK